MKIEEKNPFFWKTPYRRNKTKNTWKNIGKILINNKEILIDGNFYISIIEALRQLNIPTLKILWRIKSKNPKFYNYKYVNEDISTQPSEILFVDDVDNCEVQNLQLDNH